MQTVYLKVPVGVSSLAHMMKMEESEIRFFSHLEELREMIKKYNFGVSTKQALVENLEGLATKCNEENLHAYADGARELKRVVQYNY